MAVAGKVLTGFSKPYVALYAAAGTTVTYSSGAQLARGVSVSVSPEAADSANIFYADNGPAEQIAGAFTGGTVTLTVDGLFANMEKLIYGLPTADAMTVGTDTVDVYKYGDEATAPDCGVGWIERWMSEGTTSYTARVLRKVQFQPKSEEAATEGENIEWQTTELTANILRDDTADHDWKWFTEDLTSEADAEKALKVMLGISIA